VEGHCSTGQSPQWAVVPMEEEEEVVSYLVRKLVNMFITRALLLTKTKLMTYSLVHNRSVKLHLMSFRIPMLQFEG